MNQIDKAKQAVVTAPKAITVYEFFESQKELIRKALPKTITPDRMVSLFTMAIKSSPEIMNCSQASLIAAVIQTIQLGFLPIPSTGHIYYVPFNNRKRNGQIVREVQFILGYKGMIELINRSRDAAILSAECVYGNDGFEYSFGLSPTLIHKPVKENRGNIIGVYAVAKNKIVDEKLFVYLSKDEIEKVKSASKAGGSDYSPWSKWYEEMAKKTAIKRIAKLLPLSIDIQKQLSTDETVKTEIAPDMTEIRDETDWEQENGAIDPSKQPVLAAETLQDKANALKPDKDTSEAPKPIFRGSITEKQEIAIRELARKRYLEKWDIELLNRVGAEFGVEALCAISTEQAAGLIRELGKEIQDVE